MSEAMNGRKRAGTAAAAPVTRMPLAPPRRNPGAAEPEEAESPGLTDEQIQELRTMLDERRVQLLASIDERRGQERDTGREVGDEMDEASTEGVSSMTSKLLERDVQLLNEIDRALARMNEGAYGLCEGTGEPIGYSRLRLRPWARFSVGYQEELERAERGRGGP
jgi:DnaK suppressor protein